MAPNDQRMTQNDPKWPENDPKWPKITPNDPKMTPEFTHFFCNFFTEKAVPQTFSFLECMLICILYYFILLQCHLKDHDSDSHDVN